MQGVTSGVIDDATPVEAVAEAEGADTVTAPRTLSLPTSPPAMQRSLQLLTPGRVIQRTARSNLTSARR
jgi:hypothetical protein